MKNENYAFGVKFLTLNIAQASLALYSLNWNFEKWGC